MSRKITHPEGNVLWKETACSTGIELARKKSHFKVLSINCLSEWETEDLWVCSAVMSPDNRLVAAIHGDNTGKVWSCIESEMICTLKGHEEEFIKMFNILPLKFSPDSSRILSTDMDKTARLWDAETGLELETFLFNSQNGIRARFSSDGQLLLTIDYIEKENNRYEYEIHGWVAEPYHVEDLPGNSKMTWKERYNLSKVRNF